MIITAWILPDGKHWEKKGEEGTGELSRLSFPATNRFARVASQNY